MRLVICVALNLSVLLFHWAFEHIQLGNCYFRLGESPANLQIKEATDVFLWGCQTGGVAESWHTRSAMMWYCRIKRSWQMMVWTTTGGIAKTWSRIETTQGEPHVSSWLQKTFYIKPLIKASNVMPCALITLEPWFLHTIKNMACRLIYDSKLPLWCESVYGLWWTGKLSRRIYTTLIWSD